jgi:hypothetical protein
MWRKFLEYSKEFETKKVSLISRSPYFADSTDSATVAKTPS